ncbi:phage regulatory CII family protein [Parapusillimonas sp. JC17]|uniref:phage regulatory CII family protein n=1 Tax=Parapusillimonas sp. JC17 TaxID=3445768 RepID=UPI003FA103CE
MTCYYSDADWRDVLYTSVCNTDGGVVDAARFLTVRRGRSIHPEVLRTRLKHKDGQAISIEMAEMLTEWMETKSDGRARAHDWLHALNGRFGLTAAQHQAASGTDACLLQAIQTALIGKTIEHGSLAAEIAQAVADGRISGREADAIEALGRQNQRKTEEIIRAARQAAGKP